MPETFLYLTTTGRKTGLPRSIEIWFVELDGRYYMVSERRDRSNWVRNLLANPEVTFSVGTRSDRDATRPLGKAIARVVPDDARVTAAMDEKYDWSDGLIVELSPVE